LIVSKSQLHLNGKSRTQFRLNHAALHVSYDLQLGLVVLGFRLLSWIFAGCWQSGCWIFAGKFGSQCCNDVRGMLQRAAENTERRCHHV